MSSRSRDPIECESDFEVDYNPDGAGNNARTVVDHSTGTMTLIVDGAAASVAITASPLGMRQIVEAIFDGLERIAMKAPETSDAAAPVLIATDPEAAKQVLRCHGESLRLAKPDDIERIGRLVSES